MKCPDCGGQTYLHTLASTARSQARRCIDCGWLDVDQGEHRVDEVVV